jgi:hypothetical protein
MRAVSGFPDKSAGGPILGFSRKANLSLVLAVVLRLQSVSSFTPRPSGRRATPNLLPSLRRGRFRQPSPLRRLAGTPSPVAYRFDLPTVGRRRTSPVMAWNHFLQAATCGTHGSPPPITAYSAEGRASDSPVLHQGAATGTPHRPKRRLPKSSCLAPSTRPLLRTPRWDRASFVPPMNYEVRAGSSVRARTRTGRLWRIFSLLSLPHRLFLGRLNSKPLRLTRPSGAERSKLVYNSEAVGLGWENGRAFGPECIGTEAATTCSGPNTASFTVPGAPAGSVFWVSIFAFFTFAPPF